MKRFLFILLLSFNSMALEYELSLVGKDLNQFIAWFSDTTGFTVIVDSQIDLTVNVQPEDNLTFFKQLAVVNAVSKEQQENFLVYQKTSKSIDVGLSKTQIIYPFHWFT